MGTAETQAGTVTELVVFETAANTVNGLASTIEEEASQLSVTTASSTDRLQTILQENPDGIVYVCSQTGTDKFSVLRMLRQEEHELPVVVTAVEGSEQLASDALKAGATDYVPYTRVTESPGVVVDRLERAVTRLDTGLPQWETVFDRLTQPVVEVQFDEKHRPLVQEVNAAFEERFGYSEQDIRGESLDRVIVPDQHSEEARTISRRVAAGEVVDARVVTRKTSEGLREFLLQTTGCDASGTAFAIYTALSESQEQKQQLKQLQQRYQTYIEHTLDVVTVLQPDGTITYQSPAGERVLGYPQQELLGEDAFEFVHPDDRVRVKEQFKTAVSSENKVGRVEFRFRHADGSWVWLETLGSSRRLPGGYLTVSRDITERKRRERELRHERDRLDEFASSIAHNFRNPLNVALGALREAREHGEYHRLEATETALERMDQLVDELLALTREGAPIGTKSSVAVNEIARSAFKHVSTDELDLEVRMSTQIQADASRLQSVFVSLFDNVVTHGEGASQVTVGPLPAGDGFYVADDGTGISTGKRERIFKSGYTTSEHGTGFGLAIVKQVANAHGWEVSVTESAAGGARFEFSGVDIHQEGV